MKQALLLPCLLFSIYLFAQHHNDCSSAVSICSKQTIYVDSLFGPGANNAELNEGFCFYNGQPGNIEANSYWIRFTATQSGSLSLLITPNSPSDDLDFVLFRVADSSDCQQKQMLRCMAAGDNIFPSPCMGQTGLLASEIDTTADAGCTDFGDNNFLAPVDLIGGESYLVCVQDFTTANGFRIEFCGSALLGCETTTCADFLTASHSPLRPEYRLHGLYPNPANTSSVTLDLEMEKAGNIAYTLVNVLGQIVREKQFFLPEGRRSTAFPVDQLPDGAYWLQMTDGRSLLNRAVQIMHP